MLKIVELKHFEKEIVGNNKLFAILGSYTPTGSIKDVTVFQMLKNYQKKGVLKKDGTIIEATSGNTGIALSYYQKEFNYKCIIVMPSSMSEQRRMMIKKYGAELVLVDGGMEECKNKAQELSSAITDAFIFEQFESDFNPLAHYEYTGPFIEKNIGHTDYLFAGIGTGGTISGTAKYLKEKGNVTAIGIEPMESPLLTKGEVGKHLIQGIGANFIPHTLKRKYVDDVITVSSDSAINMAKSIREKEKLDIGISSGAAFKGAIDYILKNNITNEVVAIVFPDKGDRYTW